MHEKDMVRMNMIVKTSSSSDAVGQKWSGFVNEIKKTLIDEI